jgi:hypothetical protein
MSLEIHPELRAVAKVKAQPERSIGGNAPAIADDFGDPVRRDANVFGELVLREAVVAQKFLFQHFAGRNRRKFIPFHRKLRSMIIHNPHPVRLPFDPFEHHAPLVVDPD